LTLGAGLNELQYSKSAVTSKSHFNSDDSISAIFLLPECALYYTRRNLSSSIQPSVTDFIHLLLTSYITSWP